MSIENVASINQSVRESQNREINLGQAAGQRLRKVAAILLAVGSVMGCVAEEAVLPTPASADTLDYPDSGMPCEHAPYAVTGDADYCANYDWGPTHTPAYDDPSELSNRGYAYRNCTDYVAWKEAQVGATVPHRLGNGGNWYNAVPSSQQSTTPAAWDAAVKPGNPGHVAFVESVNSIDPNNPGNDNITVSEYNEGENGTGDFRTGTAASMGFTEFVDFGVHPSSSPNGTPVAGPTFMPAAIQRPSGESDVAVVGPGNSLDLYYNAQGSTTWGKVTVPGAQAYSTPSVVQRSSGETDIAVQGPNNSLDFYYNTQGSPNWGKITIAGAGTTYSAPAVVQRPSGETDIAVQGSNNQLAFYYNAAGSPNWGGGVVPGTQAYGIPAVAQRSSGETDVAVQGAGNSLNMYFNAQGSGSWGTSAIAVPGYAFSAPSIIQRSTGETDVAVQGPGNKLDFYFNTVGSLLWGYVNAAGPSTTYNAPNPPAMVQRSSGETDIAVQGPGNQTDLYFNAQGSTDWGESIAAVNDYGFRAPALVQRPTTGETDLAVIGPSNRLDFYFNAQGGLYWGWAPIAGTNSAS